jgi:uncharacterized protein
MNKKPLEKRVINYENGQCRAQAFCRGKKEEGEFKAWHPNGQLWIREFHSDGRPNGQRQVWYENGQIQETSFSRKGFIEGERKTWRENGRLWKKEFFYDNENRRNNIVWYQDGNIRIKEYYYKGKIDGENREWYPNGKLLHWFFRNGKPIDKSFTFRKKCLLLRLKNRLKGPARLINCFLIDDLAKII